MRKPYYAINALLGEGRETMTALRAEHERIWLADNRPSGLANVLALYDRDLRIWSDRIESFRQIEQRVRMGTPAPPPESIDLF